MANRGSCLCGAVQLEIDEPKWCAHCHWRRLSPGSVSTPSAFHAFWVDRVDWVVLGDDLRHFGGETGTEPID